MGDEYLSTEMAAKRLRVTSQTIRRWIRAGEFPNARPKRPTGRSPFEIPESDIIAYEQRRDNALKLIQN